MNLYFLIALGLYVSFWIWAFFDAKQAVPTEEELDWVSPTLENQPNQSVIIPLAHE